MYDKFADFNNYFNSYINEIFLLFDNLLNIIIFI